MINVVKFNGESEPYSEEKAYKSAIRAGASRSLAEAAVRDMRKELYDGISTFEISEKIKRMLGRENKKAALRFNLKKAIKKLGPTGFPFEKYVAEIFKSNGYHAKNNLFLKGKCCTHEIDFTAEKDNVLYIGECKYRNLPSGKVHTKDALANYARFLDIIGEKSFNNQNVKSLLVTNNKFTSRTVKYSKCVGVELLGWRYPAKEGLEYLIESQKLYPITILPSLKSYFAEILVSDGIMMAKDLLDENLAGKIRLSSKNLDKLIQEARILIL